MSPAPSSAAGLSSLPCGWPSWPIRSFSRPGDVEGVGVRAQGAPVDAEEVDPAGVGVGERLEDVGDEGPVLVGLDLDLLAARAGRRHRAAHRRRGQVLDQRLEQAAGAEVARRHAAGDREEPPRRHALLQRADDLVVVDLLAVEVALHQLVGVLRHLVHQLLAVLLGPVAQLVGDLHLLGRARPGPLVDEGLAVDQVDHAADLLLGADRDLGGDDVRAEGRLQRVEHAEEIGPLAVEHVDEDEAGQPAGVGPAPEPLGVDLDPHHAVDDDHGRVGDPQGGDRVGDEARLPGRVDQVDLPPGVLEAGKRGVDRHPALLLVGLVIGDRRPVGDRAEAADRAGLEQHRLVQARLAAAPVPDQGDVANPVCGLVRHAIKVHPERLNSNRSGLSDKP